ncbi:MAG: LAGLIDADG family homing endonuclease, partial [Proteobacteria bacterium]|nr:LAGLIDADG family homing endonuclease [Pseudomonadota bacterium]
MFATSPRPDVAQWLSGFFDGDGSLTGRPKGVIGKGFIAFTQTDNHPAILIRLKESLTALGFDWKEYEREVTQDKWSRSWSI